MEQEQEKVSDSPISDKQKKSDRVIDAAYVAVEAHASRLDIEGDHESKVRELLISLHEYCGLYAVDLVRQFADVRRQIDSGEIASPEWRKWNGPAELAESLATTDETLGIKTLASDSITESSNGVIVVTPEERKLVDGKGPFAVRTFEGYVFGDKNAEYTTLDSALLAFLSASPEVQIPRMLIGNNTVLEFDPENSLIPVFWGDEGKAVESVYFRLAAEVSSNSI